MSHIRVLVIDDSALMRQLLTKILSHHPDIEVVGTAPDPIVAWKKIQELSPDVITLDVEMPKMDGLTFLSQVMAQRPMPVVMVSALTARGAETTLQALELGAVDFVTKPKIDVSRGTAEISEDIIDKVLAASKSKILKRRPASQAEAVASTSATIGLIEATHKVIAIGASTGGTEALARLLPAFPADAPGIVVVQHMPMAFTSAFAKRLNGMCRMRVMEAQDGSRILQGTVLIAPGDSHMQVVRRGAEYSVALNRQPPVNGFRPSVDVLFHSCAEQLGGNAAAALLTGMGRDGAAGMLAMRRAGAHTVAQDEDSCVVFGMPREAIAMGAAAQVLPLESIAMALLAAMAPRGVGSARQLTETCSAR